MKIGILGTGDVGQKIGAKLVELGHEVKLGSRSATNEKALEWAKKAGANASAGTFKDAAAFGEVLFNCTKGEGSVAALTSAGEANLGTKVLVDVSNPLDFSKGFPPSLLVSNTDSLAETIQRAFPKLRVVKALNTLANPIMVNPRLLSESTQTFLAGNDAGAKETVLGILKQFGWKPAEVLDLGDLPAARGLEQWLPLWVRIMGATKTPMFNLRIVTAESKA